MGCKFGQPLKTIPNEAEVLAEASRLRKKNVSWDNVALAVGQSKTWVRYRLDPEYRHRRREQSIKAVRGHDSRMERREVPALTQQELRERLSLVPKDTRDLTGRICGDPIPNDPRRQDAA